MGESNEHCPQTASRRRCKPQPAGAAGARARLEEEEVPAARALPAAARAPARAWRARVARSGQAIIINAPTATLEELQQCEIACLLVRAHDTIRGWQRTCKAPAWPAHGFLTFNTHEYVHTSRSHGAC